MPEERHRVPESDAFTPQALSTGARTRIPIVFPDGTSVTLVAPSSLGVHRMAAQPDVTFVWEGRHMGSIVFAFGGRAGRILSGRAPVETVESPDGRRVAVWTARRPKGYPIQPRRWLIFRLPDWTVHVPLDRRAEAREVVRAVDPRQTSDGWVVLGTEPPASLSRIPGDAGGPQVSFGDSDPLEAGIRGVRVMEVAPETCRGQRPRIEHAGSYGTVCIAHGEVSVQVQVFENTPQERAFVRDVVRELEGVRFRRRADRPLARRS